MPENIKPVGWTQPGGRESAARKVRGDSPGGGAGIAPQAGRTDALSLTESQQKTVVEVSLQNAQAAEQNVLTLAEADRLATSPGIIDALRKSAQGVKHESVIQLVSGE
jgi:hypothetical protein